jgi:hypothetical protein
MPFLSTLSAFFSPFGGWKRTASSSFFFFLPLRKRLGEKKEHGVSRCFPSSALFYQSDLVSTLYMNACTDPVCMDCRVRLTLRACLFVVPRSCLSRASSCTSQCSSSIAITFAFSRAPFHYVRQASRSFVILAVTHHRALIEKCYDDAPPPPPLSPPKMSPQEEEQTQTRTCVCVWVVEYCLSHSCTKFFSLPPLFCMNAFPLFSVTKHPSSLASTAILLACCHTLLRQTRRVCKYKNHPVSLHNEWGRNARAHERISKR